MVESARLSKVSQDVNELYAGGLALPEALLLGAAHRVLAEPREAGDGGIGGVEMPIQVRLQVPHELWLDGQEGGDHDRQEKPTL